MEDEQPVRQVVDLHLALEPIVRDLMRNGHDSRIQVQAVDELLRCCDDAGEGFVV